MLRLFCRHVQWLTGGRMRKRERTRPKVHALAAWLSDHLRRAGLVREVFRVAQDRACQLEGKMTAKLVVPSRLRVEAHCGDEARARRADAR